MRSPPDSRLVQRTFRSLAGRAEWLGFLERKLGNHDDAEDILQASLVKVLGKVRSCAPMKASSRGSIVFSGGQSSTSIAPARPTSGAYAPWPVTSRLLAKTRLRPRPATALRSALACCLASRVCLRPTPKSCGRSTSSAGPLPESPESGGGRSQPWTSPCIAPARRYGWNCNDSAGPVPKASASTATARPKDCKDSWPAPSAEVYETLRARP